MLSRLTVPLNKFDNDNDNDNGNDNDNNNANDVTQCSINSSLEDQYHYPRRNEMTGEGTPTQKGPKNCQRFLTQN